MIYGLAKPLIFRLDAEKAHRATIAALKAIPDRPVPKFDTRLRQDVAGLSFPSPVGLAAGFDKDAEVFAPMLGLGFGFVEVGTLTPEPQEGNEKPRLFRLKEDRAVINRMGFNNAGQFEAARRLRQRRRGRGVVGVNVGANKDSADRIADYAAGVRKMAPLADYITVNISSPNTPDLRKLQDTKSLTALLAAVREARADLPSTGLGEGEIRRGRAPVFLKVAPDLDARDPKRIVDVAIEHGVDAIIIGNTTIERPDTLQSPHADQAGGLSGRPLKDKAFDMLRRFHEASAGRIPLIAAGGIENGDDAWERIRAGASLVQVYSALVYEGPGLAMKIAGELVQRMEAEGVAHIADLVGSE